MINRGEYNKVNKATSEALKNFKQWTRKKASKNETQAASTLSHCKQNLKAAQENVNAFDLKIQELKDSLKEAQANLDSLLTKRGFTKENFDSKIDALIIAKVNELAASNSQIETITQANHQEERNALLSLKKDNALISHFVTAPGGNGIKDPRRVEEMLMKSLQINFTYFSCLGDLRSLESEVNTISARSVRKALLEGSSSLVAEGAKLFSGTEDLGRAIQKHNKLFAVDSSQV